MSERGRGREKERGKERETKREKAVERGSSRSVTDDEVGHPPHPVLYVNLKLHYENIV